MADKNPQIDTDPIFIPKSDLSGKTALVTGAGKGLGRAAAYALSEVGAEVILNARTEEDLKRVQKELQDLGREKVRYDVFDVTNWEEVNEKVAAMERVDILVNCAGGNIPEPFVDVTEEHLDHLTTLNIKGTFAPSQAVVKKMIELGDGGSIIHMSSQMGHIGSAGRTNYCTTKHGIEGLTKAMAVELAEHQIRVNAIAATFIETPMTRPFFENKKFTDMVFQYLKLGRVGQYEDFMGAVVYLASDQSALVTGSSLKVDGGWTAH